jgi:hypothetical protein
MAHNREESIMQVSQNICGLKLGDKITAPMPFDGTAEIMGFRYYTSHNTGRTCIVADYIMNDGKVSFDPVQKLVPLKI